MPGRQPTGCTTAKLCGYPTYAHRVTAESLAGGPERVGGFLTDLSIHLTPRLEQDYDILLRMKRRSFPESKYLEIWDVPFYSSQVIRTFCLKKCEHFSLQNIFHGLGHSLNLETGCAI